MPRSCAMRLRCCGSVSRWSCACCMKALYARCRCRSRATRRATSALDAAATSVLVRGLLLARALARAVEHVLARHARIAGAAQREQPAEDQRDDQRDDDEGLHGAPFACSGLSTRISPSCAVLATRFPSRVKMLPRLKPRASEALGESVAYRSHSSTRTRR